MFIRGLSEHISDRGSTWSTEAATGLTISLATAYIIMVNPAILSNTGMPFSGVLTATTIVSAFSSIMMGLYAKNLVVVAPGMGINAFFIQYPDLYRTGDSTLIAHAPMTAGTLTFIRGFARDHPEYPHGSLVG